MKLQENAPAIVQLVDGVERIAILTGQSVTELVASILGVPIEADPDELEVDHANGGAALRPPQQPATVAVAGGAGLVE